MDALQQVIEKIDEYIGSLIDIAAMPEVDKAELKDHLLKAQVILLRNGNVKLNEFVSAITHSILSRF